MIRKSTGLPLLAVSLYSPKKTHDSLFLGNYANINIVDALLRVPGVGQVLIFGTADYAMRIWVKPDVLAKLGLTVPDLSKAIQQQSAVNPAGQVGASPAPSGQENDADGPRARAPADRGGIRRDRRALESRRIGRPSARTSRASSSAR